MSDHQEKAAAEAALVDADLFLKYRMPQRAIAALEEVLSRFPYNTDLRWKLADLCIDVGFIDSAIEQLTFLADVFSYSNQLDLARSALHQAQTLMPDNDEVNSRLSRLETPPPTPQIETATQFKPQRHVLSGDLHYISLFDVIQTLEKNQLTGIITVTLDQPVGTLYFNRGLLVDAIHGQLRAKEAFKCFAEITEGTFELVRSPVEFQPSITAESNAQLILEIFSEEDNKPFEF